MSHNNNLVNGATPQEDDDSGTDHSSSDSVSSMSSEEIESHFVERHSRRYQALASRIGLYPLPVDDLEGQRQDRLHDLVKELFGGHNYQGPIQRALNTAVDGRRSRVLDICTGNGKWVNEMAAEFPSAKIYGLDIVPLATRYPADNVQFEIHDINSPTRWVPGRFDVVHMRHIYLSPVNCYSFIYEVARLLRPCHGLFLYGELMPDLFAREGAPSTSNLPGISDLFRHLSDFATGRNLFYSPLLIQRMLRSSNLFEEPETSRIFIPLDDSPRGRRAKQILLDFSCATRGFLIDSGLTALQAQGILQAVRRDLERSEASEVCLAYLTVRAKRRALVP